MKLTIFINTGYIIFLAKALKISFSQIPYADSCDEIEIKCIYDEAFSS